MSVRVVGVEMDCPDVLIAAGSELLLRKFPDGLLQLLRIRASRSRDDDSAGHREALPGRGLCSLGLVLICPVLHPRVKRVSVGDDIAVAVLTLELAVTRDVAAGLGQVLLRLDGGPVNLDHGLRRAAGELLRLRSGAHAAIAREEPRGAALRLMRVDAAAELDFLVLFRIPPS